MEYSAREVSPAQLLLKQLTRAHELFMLHQETTLQHLYNKVGRSSFCSLLERFWSRYIRDWDVLLHGNPAVEIYKGIKVASGGELGIGVGEEEWGSGEREVLEDFIRRADGCIDLVVSRFGDEPVESGDETKQPKVHSAHPIRGTEPWLGQDRDPSPADGVVFGGVGAVSRKSLSTISQWIEAIFRHGEDAYGVGESPNSRPRRQRQIRGRTASSIGKPAQSEPRSRIKSPMHKDPDLRRTAMENRAASPGIPPPLVVAVERSLDEALSKAHSDTKGKESTREKAEGETTEQTPGYGTDKMMNYLTLGYGKSWTLSPKGFAKDSRPAKDPKTLPSGSGNAGSETGQQTNSSNAHPDETGPIEPPMQQLDPTPEVSDDDEVPFVQRLEQSIGKFIIGLSGDLENTEFNADDEEADDKGVDQSSSTQPHPSQRLFLRTLTIDMAIPSSGPSSINERPTAHTRSSAGSDPRPQQPPTSAESSIDGPVPIHGHYHRKVQVTVYVHQPFIFCFLFELHTPSLTMASFYRNLHHQLGPLQRPLLASTDPQRARERLHQAGLSDPTSTAAIHDLIFDPATLNIRASIPNIPPPGSLAAEGFAPAPAGRSPKPVTVSGSWYTLGIPISSSSPSPSDLALPPTSPASAAAGRGSRTADPFQQDNNWTRIEALNVHSQILHTFVATRRGRESERTVRTTRGWWAVWLTLHPHPLSPPHQRQHHHRPASQRDSDPAQEERAGEMEVVLVRRAVADGKRRRRVGVGMFSSGNTTTGGGDGGEKGRWLNPVGREVSGESWRGGAGGVEGDGLGSGGDGGNGGGGVDVRRYAEGLMMFL